jgi:hypothetical protein
MTTYLGLTRRAAIATALVAVTVGGAIGLAIPTPDVCAIVEHGPTGPEPDVTLGRTVEVCRDGSAIVTTWDLTTGDVLDVDHDPHQLTPAEVADLADRLDVIRETRTGGRFAG